MFEVTGLSEAQIEALSIMMDALGYQYDEDYTCLYGAGWGPVGIRTLSSPATLDLFHILCEPWILIIIA